MESFFDGGISAIASEPHFRLERAKADASSPREDRLPVGGSFGVYSRELELSQYSSSSSASVWKSLEVSCEPL